MFNKSFLKQSSFCVLGTSSVSFLQSSYGFAADNQNSITYKKALQSSAASKDSLDENSKLMENQEAKVEIELQKERIFQTAEEYFITRINDKEFRGFFGKIYLALKLMHIIPAYLTLKVEDLLKVGEWPEALKIIGFIIVRCIFRAFFKAILLFTYAFALFGLVIGLKYLGQKSEEGISKLINIINVSKDKVADDV